jgi:hypothetical protein
LLAGLSIVEVGESHIGIKSSSGTVEPAVVYLRVILLELHKAMVYAVLVVVAIIIRISSYGIGMQLKRVEEIVYYRDNLLKGSITPYSSIAFCTLSCPIKRHKQLLKLL